jgi:hypothetical protein
LIRPIGHGAGGKGVEQRGDTRALFSTFRVWDGGGFQLGKGEVVQDTGVEGHEAREKVG